MREKLLIIWMDGKEEEVACDSFSVTPRGTLVICTNPATRHYRYIPLGNVREYRKL